MAAPLLKKERAKDASAKIQEKGAAAMKYIMKADKEAHKEAHKAFLKKEEQLAAPVIEKKKKKSGPLKLTKRSTALSIASSKMMCTMHSHVLMSRDVQRDVPNNAAAPRRPCAPAIDPW